jgi:L-gulonolactone oxidase
MIRVVSVDPAHHQLTVEAGMTLLDLANAAEANNMSMRPGAFSVYSNLTVGGMITASAHGSGLGTVSSLGSLVRKIKWVNAKGEILVSDSKTEAGAKEVNALVGGLGLLGISTEFTLQLEPNSWTIIEGRENLSDKNIVADLKHMLKHETPHVITLWRPDLGTYRVQMFTHVGANETLPSTAPAFNPTGRNAYFAPFDDQTAGFFGDLMAASDGDVADESAAADAINAGQ